MSESTATVQVQPHTSALNRRTTNRKRVLNLTLWLFQALLAFQFSAGGFLKLNGDPAMVEMFAAIGAGQWLRYMVGGLEIAGALALLLPRLSGPAALGLVGLMVGAAATNALILGTSPWPPLAFLALSALIARGRLPQARTLLGKPGR